MDDKDKKGIDKTAADHNPSPQEDGHDSAPPSPAAPAYAESQDDYPLRAPEDDPRWAVRTVKIWFGIALAFLAFILTLMLLGVFYD